MGRWEKRVARENGIRTARQLAIRIKIEYGEVNPWTIDLHCPEASPRFRAMIRSIVVNGGIVDSPHNED